MLAVGHINGVLGLVDPQSGTEWAHLYRSDLKIASMLAFSSDQRWLGTSSIDEHSPAQVCDLQEMRRELVSRGLDLPTDVLRVRPSSQHLDEQIEIILDDTGLAPPTAPVGAQELSKARGESDSLLQDQ